MSFFGKWISPEARLRNADILAILMAGALPWSTTAFGALTAMWLVAVGAVIDPRQFLLICKRRPSMLPILIFTLAIAGMFWANSSWTSRIHAASVVVKLLAIPLFVYQFQHSENGPKVLGAFYISCIVLLCLSWLHRFSLVSWPFSTVIAGVPVKNWITQGVEFALCAYGSAALATIMWQRRRPYASVTCAIVSVAFVLNLAFVPTARTALLSLIILFPVLTFRYIGWRRSLVLYSSLLFFGGVLLALSPNLQELFGSIYQQLTWYEDNSIQASVGLRIEYWKHSLKFISEAPVLGNGTGSIRDMFAKEAVGKSVTKYEIVANPHNQTLYFAIEWGAIGVVLLFSMWISHLLVFRDIHWISWLGTLVVSQNIFDSLFNSHISDYVEGWIYVIGVGVCAGSLLRQKQDLTPRPS